ncbi:MAG: hypothetical protein M5U34_25190 [Chloroflexi bacterium]|nr:hypothetical protein [Chloroflexota bacterium]
MPAVCFTALGNHHVNIIAIAQGSSECSISLVVSGDETAEAGAAYSWRDCGVSGETVNRCGFWAKEGR